MPDIQKLLHDLKSNRAATRYDACEELRVSASITQAAMEALQVATSDPDSDVADAATRALRTHFPSRPPHSIRAAPLGAHPPPTAPILPEATTGGSPAKALFYILLPALALVVSSYLGFAPYAGYGGTLSSFMFACAPISIIGGAAAGALVYYGNLAVKRASTPTSVTQGNLAIASGVLLFLAQLIFTCFAAGLWATG